MFAKRAIVTVLVLMLAGFVVGCGGGESMDQPVEQIETTPPPTPPPVEENEDMDSGMDVEDMADPVLNDVFFAFDQHNLSSEARGILEANARELKRATSAVVVIEGHCDERGTRSYNLALGDKRAKAAYDYLVSLGVSRSQMSTISYGKERPFDTGSNERAWAKNRRAHFKLK